jgi:hypothetical protein
MAERYRIRVSNRLGPILCNLFTDMRTVAVPRHTVIEGVLSRDEFRALLLRVEQEGLEVVHVRCGKRTSAIHR